MITTPKQCPDAQRVFTEIGAHLAIAASFDGYWQPQLLVDDMHQPHSACLLLPPHAYLAGSPQNRAFNDELAQIISASYPPTHEALFFFDSPLWGALIEGIVADREQIQAIREHFTRKSAPTDWRDRVPKGITIREVDADLLSQTHLKHHDRLIAEIEMSNPSFEAFLERCFGMFTVISTVSGDEIAGWCLSENNTGTRCEVGIETIQEFQRRGLGTLMTLALVDLAHQRGIVSIGWDCWKRNIASGATALKAGFRKESEYAVLLTLAKS